jgi:SAM-dependent methyltransferase
MTQRDQRAEYIASRFVNYLKGKVLDVGCDTARLKKLVNGIEYFGIDVGGSPDQIVNLDHQGLPFPDQSQDCIVCSDVLEHLDNFHNTFHELARVCRKHIIISLPNNWANARKAIERGHGSFSHYGLPTENPTDRHKWFFSLYDAIAFVKYNAAKDGLKIQEMFAIEKPRMWLVRILRRIRYPNQIRYLNRYSHSLWVVLTR